MMMKNLFLILAILFFGCTENELPTILFNSPGQNETLFYGDTLNISVEAEDPDGTIEAIRIYIDDTGVYSDTDFPYGYDWITEVSDSGAHLIRARAYDNEDAYSEAEVSVMLIERKAPVIENLLPECQILTPKMNDTLELGESIIISAKAGDPDGEVAEVRFFIDDIGIASDKEFPYTITWDTEGFTAGSHRVIATAIDDLDSSYSDTVMVYLLDPESENINPSCIISAPEDNDVFGIGDTVLITVEAADSDGFISEVRFFLDGTGIGSDTEFPFSFEWYTMNTSVGTHIIKAVALDNDGGSAESEILLNLEPSDKLPDADFMADLRVITEGDSVQFTDLSTNNPQSWLWDLGNGETSTEQHPAHMYMSPGTYSISLTATNTYGSDTETKSEYILVEETCIGCDTDTISDIEGNVYNTVRIGDRWWMAENLNSKKYVNGDAINFITDSLSFYSTEIGSVAYFGYDEATYGDTYGALYNWYAVADNRNVCPNDNWHVPTRQEFSELSLILGGDHVAGKKLKETGGAHWVGGNQHATNESGFTALPSGSTDAPGSLGYRASFWTSVSKMGDWAYYFELEYHSDSFQERDYWKRSGFAVRCIKDSD